MGPSKILQDHFRPWICCSLRAMFPATVICIVGYRLCLAPCFPWVQLCSLGFWRTFWCRKIPSPSSTRSPHPVIFYWRVREAVFVLRWTCMATVWTSVASQSFFRRHIGVLRPTPRIRIRRKRVPALLNGCVSIAQVLGESVLRLCVVFVPTCLCVGLLACSEHAE